MTKRKRSLGWKPDLPDHRDHMFSVARPPVLGSLPRSVDLLPGMPPVYDQGSLGSCTANAIAAAVDFGRVKQGVAPFSPSRLFIYYNEREMEGTVAQDSGAQIRDGVKSVAKLGVCPEKRWGYEPERFTERPPRRCYRAALRFQTLEYRRIENTNLIDMLRCLAEGFPFVFGFSVYDSFMGRGVATTGVLDLPAKAEKLQGGHAVVAVGYNRDAKTFLVRNSWGSAWGSGGHFSIPFDYLTNTNLAADFWTLRKVE